MTKYQVHSCSDQTIARNTELSHYPFSHGKQVDRNCHDTVEIQNTDKLRMHETAYKTNLIPKKHCTPFLKK